MKRPHKIFNETYNANILFFHDHTHEEVLSYINKKFNIIIDDGFCTGLSVELKSDEGKSIFVFWVNRDQKKEKLFGTIVHEITHVTNDILTSRGVKISIKHNDEPQAYLNGWLAQECFKKIK